MLDWYPRVWRTSHLDTGGPGSTYRLLVLGNAVAVYKILYTMFLILLENITKSILFQDEKTRGACVTAAIEATAKDFQFKSIEALSQN